METVYPHFIGISRRSFIDDVLEVLDREQNSGSIREISSGFALFKEGEIVRRLEGIERNSQIEQILREFSEKIKFSKEIDLVYANIVTARIIDLKRVDEITPRLEKDYGLKIVFYSASSKETEQIQEI